MLPLSPLRLYNTLTKAVEEFTPASPASITFYSCGPTVYDDAHIGNFRSFLAADVLRRWLESPLCSLANDPAPVSSRRVTHVMNITDVGHMTDDAEGGEAGEDRMALAGQRLAEAKKSGKIPANVNIDPGDPYAVARFYEDRFKDDARRLGLKLVLDADADPSRMPRATENVPGMIVVIQRLIDQGFAYVRGEPGARVVYFGVRRMTSYGQLSGNTLDKLREGEGGRISSTHQSQKEHPADFLLWKEDPTHLMKWESPWGKGYPGWHIECTVMSAGRLALAANNGSTSDPASPAFLDRLKAFSVPGASPLIDLHSGGEDNIFPHHECEIAQTCACFNTQPQTATYAKLWFHPRFLFVNGQKMSKSKGNFYTPRELFEKGHEPAAVRLELIRIHYRSNANFTEQGLKDSARMIERWRKVADATDASPQATAANLAARERLLAEFAMAMQDDLNIAGAIAAVNTFAGAVVTPTIEDAKVMKLIDGTLGVLDLARPRTERTDIGIFLGGLAPDPAVLAKLEDRRAARAAKDFKRSDQIRDELLAMGFAIKDVAGSKVEVSRT